MEPQLGHSSLTPFSEGIINLPQLLHIGGVEASAITGPLLLEWLSDDITINLDNLRNLGLKNIMKGY